MHIYFLWEGAGNYIDQWVHVHFVSELERHGNRVTLYNPVPRLGAARTHERLHDDLLAHLATTHEANPIDLFFSFAFDELISVETLEAIRRRGIPLVNFSCDNIEVPHRMMRIARHFDLYWLPEPEAVDLFRNEYGANVYYAPMAANPYVFEPKPALAETMAMAVCGNRYGSRERYIPRLLDAGCDVQIFGQGWQGAAAIATSPISAVWSRPWESARHIADSLGHMYGRISMLAAAQKMLFPERISPALEARVKQHAHGVVSFEKMVALFSEARVTLGFNERGQTYLLRKPLLQIRLRDFEAVMSGACYLMYRIPEMQGYLREGEEVLYYASLEELIEKARFYADPRRDTERSRLRANARKRALGEHTWMHRFSGMLASLNPRLKLSR